MLLNRKQQRDLKNKNSLIESSFRFQSIKALNLRLLYSVYIKALCFN